MTWRLANALRLFRQAGSDFRRDLYAARHALLLICVACLLDGFWKVLGQNAPAIATAIILGIVIISGWRHRRLLFKTHPGNWCYWLIAAACVGLAYGLLTLVQHGFETPLVFIQQVVTSAGGVFAFVTGTASLIGLFLTYQSVRELGQNITSFDELAERVITLAKTVRNGDTSDVLRIASWTPAIGFFALDDKLYNNLTKELTELHDGAAQCKIVCLELNDMDKSPSGPLADWHAQYSGLQCRRFPHGVQSVEIAAANAASATTLSRIRPANYAFAKEEVLPDYYFFVTRKSAIIVAPLHLPLLALKATKTTPEAKAKIVIRPNDLEMVGIETSDRRVIEGLLHLHQQLMEG